MSTRIRRTTAVLALALAVGLGTHAAGGQRIYWIDSAFPDSKIQRANLDGTDVEDLVTTGLTFPASIVIDRAAGKMYWIDRILHNPDKIQRANLDGSNVEDVVAVAEPNELRA